MLSWTISKRRGAKQGLPHAIPYYDSTFHTPIAVRNKLYYFGGQCDKVRLTDISQIHVFNTVSLRWKKLPPTKPEQEHHLEAPIINSCGLTAVLIEGTVYFWGGYHTLRNSLQAFDVYGHTWSEPRVSGTVPECRAYHSACGLGKVMLIQGGMTRVGCTNDIYKLDTNTMFWTLVNARGTVPPPNLGHSATIIGTKMYVFGECGLGLSVNSLSVFDTETNHWLNRPAATLLTEARCGHSAFTYNGELYIFGGMDSEHLNKDFWKFNPQSYSWKKVVPKGTGPRAMFSMSDCMVGNCLILFDRRGPRSGNDDIEDLFILDFSPSLKTLCKLAVIHYGLDESELPHNIRWELVAMTTNDNAMLLPAYH